MQLSNTLDVRSSRAMKALAAVALIFFARYAEAILLPVAVALVLTFLLSPLVRGMLLQGVSWLGDGALWYVTIAALALAGGTDGRDVAAQMTLVGVFNLTLYLWLKARIGRPRPYVKCPDIRACGRALDQFSFPSGHGARWIAVDLIWSTAGGLAVGWVGGVAVAHVMRRLQGAGRPIVEVEFLVLGMIALIYGAALVLQTYGFLAVFAGGLALGRTMQHDSALADGRAAGAPAGLRASVVSWARVSSATRCG